MLTGGAGHASELNDTLLFDPTETGLHHTHHSHEKPDDPSVLGENKE